MNALGSSTYRHLITYIKASFWYQKRHSNTILLRREICPLAIPIFVENLSMILMGVFSTLLVSWLGKEEMAAVGLADSFNMIIIAFFMAVALGTSVIVAFNLGKRNRKTAVEATRQSISLLVLISLALVLVVELEGVYLVELIAGDASPEVKDLAVTYLRLTVWGYPALAYLLVGCGALRGAGNTKLPMYVNIIMNILNLLISYWLIYGIFNWQGLGFIGAGIGMTIARYIGALLVGLALTYGPRRTLRIAPKSYFYGFNLVILIEVFSIGIPASIESVMFNVGKLITQMFIAGMGTAVIAGSFITFSIVGLINIPGNSLGAAGTIIIGKRLGMGQILQPKRQLSYIFGLSNCCLCLLALLSVPTAGFMASLYTDAPDVVEVVKLLIWLNAAFMPFWGAAWVLPYGLKGAKDVGFTMWVAILSMWGCRIVVGYILGIILGWGVVGIWLGMFFDWIIRAIFYYHRYHSGRWLWRYQSSTRDKRLNY